MPAFYQHVFYHGSWPVSVDNHIENMRASFEHWKCVKFIFDQTINILFKNYSISLTVPLKYCIYHYIVHVHKQVLDYR